MNEPKLNYVSCPDTSGGHRMAYWEWGDPQCPHVVVCVHGLSRQGRDFDVLARALARQVRVICPDVVGRGKSDWLSDPSGYQVPTYVGDMVALLGQVKPQVLDWVGTSMGGLIGMGVAGTPDIRNTMPVRRLVLNDVGPSIQWEALQRIGDYLGRPIHFSSLQEAADYFWSISRSFGPHTPQQWMALSVPMVKADGEGFKPHYDPGIAVPFRALSEEMARQGEAALWQLYDAISARTLLLRGAQSDLLSPATAAQMGVRGPRATLIEFDGVGHAPTLVAQDQVDAVVSFLLGDAASP